MQSNRIIHCLADILLKISYPSETVDNTGRTLSQRWMTVAAKYYRTVSFPRVDWKLSGCGTISASLVARILADNATIQQNLLRFM